MFTAAFEKQPCRNVSKINSSSEAAFKMHFSISLFCTCGEFFEEYLWWDATYSKFACTALQLWTTGAEKLYFITVLINAEQQLLQKADSVFRSSHAQMLCKIGALKDFANFTGKHLCWSLFLIKLQAWRPAILVKRDSNTGPTLWNFQNFLKTLFLQKTFLQWPFVCVLKIWVKF